MVKRIIRTLVAHTSMARLANAVVIGAVMAEAVPQLGKLFNEPKPYSFVPVNPLSV